MKVILTNTQHVYSNKIQRTKKSFVTAFLTWVKENEPVWEYNRLGIAATGIFIQVTVAAAMIGLVGLTGLSVWVAYPGILITFLANSMALAQAGMKWVLGLFLLSITVNTILIIFFLFKIL
jgi:hypothetical protein